MSVFDEDLVFESGETQLTWDERTGKRTAEGVEMHRKVVAQTREYLRTLRPSPDTFEQLFRGLPGEPPR